MNELPRREPTPLYAPPGRFEQTLRRARRRRARAAGLSMAAALVVCVGGAMALVNTQARPTRQTADLPPSVPASISTVSATPGPAPQSGPSTAVTSAPPASHHPSSHRSGRTGTTPGTGTQPGTHHSGAHHTRGGTAPGPKGGSGRTYHGVVVDHEGRPAAGVGVYVVPPDGHPEQVGHTDNDGTFQAPCDEPVLLAAKDLGPASTDTAPVQGGYTYVGGQDQPTLPDCSTPSSGGTAAPMTKTVLPQAGSVDLLVTDAAGNPVPGATEPALYCPALGDTVDSQPCYQPMTGPDGHYTFTGLTAGHYTLRSGRQSQDCTVTAGQTTDITWVTTVSGAPTSPTSSSSPSSPSSPAPTASPSTPTKSPESTSDSASQTPNR